MKLSYFGTMTFHPFNIQDSNLGLSLCLKDPAAYQIFSFKDALSHLKSPWKNYNYNKKREEVSYWVEMSLIPDNTKVPQPNEVNSPVRYIEGVRSLSPLEWRELDESPTKINPWFSLFLPLCCKVGKFFLDQGEDTTRRVYYASCSLTYLLAMVASNMALQWINYPTQVSFFFFLFGVPLGMNW